MRRDWEIWVDTNISPIIAKWIMEYTGVKTRSSYSLNLHFKDDLEIYNLAKQNGNVILLSKDADFPELISRLGSPPKLININLGNADNRTLWESIRPSIKDAIEILITSKDTDIVDFE